MTGIGASLSALTPSSRQGTEFLESNETSSVGLALRSKTQDRLDYILLHEDIGCARRISATILRNQFFDIGISGIILLNIIVMIIDANYLGECVLTGTESCELEEHPWTGTAEYVFLAIYISEVTLRLVAERWGFFQSSWNNADCLVVLAGIAEVLLSLVLARDMLTLLQVLKIFRVTRILRAIRLLRFFPHLFAMVQGFIHALVAMGWGLVMILILLVMISVIAVEIIAPNNVDHDAEWCTEAFGNVWTATIFFFQITVAGDSWGACAIPLMREHFYTSIVFVGAVCTVELGFMNLILSAIIQVAHEAQENDVQEKKQHILHKKQQSAAELRSIFRQIDRDGSGTLSYDELLAAYDDRHGKANSILTVLDVSRNDLPELFQLMDMDDSDAVGHKEFVECIRKAQVQDIRIQMLTMKLQLDRISRSVGKEVRKAVKSCLLEKGLLTKARLYESEEESQESKSWTEKVSSELEPPSKEEKLREPGQDGYPALRAARPGIRTGPAASEPGSQRADELSHTALEFTANGPPLQDRAAVGERRVGLNRTTTHAEMVPPSPKNHVHQEPPLSRPEAPPRSPRRSPARSLNASREGYVAPGMAAAVWQMSATPAVRLAATAESLPKCASVWQQEMQESASSVPKQAMLKEHFLQLREFKAALSADPEGLQHPDRGTGLAARD